ncbi:MAG: response regulator [Verrucomicrobia bacterium]|nr:response regulator [Verrucomicrobiota bacterium]MDA1088015.1 response regulator [Verrucomicrobiota bacterium]
MHEGTILLVDDEEMILSITGQMLRHVGYDVLAADSGAAAIKLFREHADDIRLTILDLSMPEMSGEEVFVKLRQIRGDAVIALSTGLADDGEIPQISGIEASGFINKPYEMTTLLNAVTDIIGRSEVS